MMGIYKAGYVISFVIVFLGCWIYSIATYGFFLGAGLGWFPSIIVAGIASAFWPLLLLGLVAIIAALSK